MSDKQPIDVQRDAAISLEIGGDDKSAATDFLSTGNSLYVIKERGIYKIQLADDIDPHRTNPNIPNLNQQILANGSNNEIVGKILLTAKYLFDERNATVNPFVANLFERCLVLTRHMLELDEMTCSIKNDIVQKELAVAEAAVKPNAIILPSIPSKETIIHNILSKADRVKDTILEIFRLQFMPTSSGRQKLGELDGAIKKALDGEPLLTDAWMAFLELFKLVRNLRNASEHPRDDQQIILLDFKMLPNGQVQPPLVEVKHPETPIDTLLLKEFIAYIRNTMLENAEESLVFIRCAVLLGSNPFGEWVGEFPEEVRRHKHVRYYRAINFQGHWSILG